MFEWGRNRKKLDKNMMSWKRFLVFSDDFNTEMVRFFFITMNINKDVANLTIFQFHVDVFCLRRTAFELLSESWIKGPFEPPPPPPRVFYCFIELTVPSLQCCYIIDNKVSELVILLDWTCSLNIIEGTESCWRKKDL